MLWKLKNDGNCENMSRIVFLPKMKVLWANFRQEFPISLFWNKNQLMLANSEHIRDAADTWIRYYPVFFKPGSEPVIWNFQTRTCWSWDQKITDPRYHFPERSHTVIHQNCIIWIIVATNVTSIHNWITWFSSYIHANRIRTSFRNILNYKPALPNQSLLEKTVWIILLQNVDTFEQIK